MFGGFKSFFRRRVNFSQGSRKFSTFAAQPTSYKVGVGIGAAGILGYFAYFDYSKTSEAEEKKTLDPNSFIKLKLTEILPVNHNTKIFRFALPGGSNSEGGFTVASFILTKAAIGEGGKDVVRPYTPITDIHQKGFFDLMIKYYPQGNMSKHIHKLKVGDTLEIKGPLTSLPYKPNMKKKIGFIAGGTGITPMYQIIRHVLSNPSDKTEISLVFANIAPEDILLKDAFDSLAKKHPNFKVYYVLEKPPKGWNQGVGFVNEDIVKKTMPTPSSDSLVMICGPPGMIGAIAGPKGPNYTQGEVGGILKKLGYSSENVFKF